MIIGALAGLVLAGLVIGLTLVLPIVAFLRTTEARREIEVLRGRLDEIDRRQTARQPIAPPPTQPATAPVPSPPPPLSPAAMTPVSRGATSPAPDLLQDIVAHARPLDLETRIGGRWLQHAGIVVVLLGVAFFLRYAFEREWFPPIVRVGVGALAGVAMAAGGVRLARTYRAYGLIMTGGGIGVLYLSVYASLNLYDLVGPAAAFALLAFVSVAAAVLADRTGSLALAFIAVCGGFATPFLVGGNTDQHLILFTYVALLVAATMYLAHRRQWPWLNVTSLGLTTVTVIAWAIAYYRSSTYLTAELFMTMYCAMFVEMLRTSWGTRKREEPAAFLLLLAPIEYHVWSIVTLSPHGLAFLIYLLAFTLVTVIVSVHYRSSVLRVAAWLAMGVPFGQWIVAHHWQGWILATTITVLAIYSVHLATHIRRVAEGEDVDDVDIGLIHANGIGVFAALFEVLTDSISFGELALIAVAFAAVNIALWGANRRRAPVHALHWLGVAFTLIAIAIWIQFGGPWAVATWMTEGVVVLWIALRAEREWLRRSAWALMAIAAYRWLQPDIQAATTADIVLVNARALTGLYLVVMAYLAAWLERRQPDAGQPSRRSERTTLVIAASVVTLAVLSAEIMSFWAIRTAAPQALFARDLMLSTSWVIYAAVLVVVGIRNRYAPIRYFAIALFGTALAKVFLFDLATAGGIYRVVGFLIVGAVLLIVSFLYQRARARGALG